jgi:hypothetical protein
VLEARFPRLVYCHITGFGDTGPLGGLPGYDAVVQAMTGLMSINGQPEHGPVRMGMPIVDIGTGLIATVAILAAVVERDRSGRGQKIDVPLYDCAISMLHPQAANALMTGKVPVATGNAHPNISPYDMYPTRTTPLYLAFLIGLFLFAVSTIVVLLPYLRSAPQPPALLVPVGIRGLVRGAFFRAHRRLFRAARKQLSDRRGTCRYRTHGASSQAFRRGPTRLLSGLATGKISCFPSSSSVPFLIR